MYLADASDATRCKAFPTTLTKAAMKWFDSLPPRSVTSFDDLSRKFLMRFSIQKDKVKHAPSLLGVKQEVGEPLRDYMERFNKACLEIQDLPTEAVIMGLVNGLREEGIETFRGDQKLARKCYNESLNLRGKGEEVHTIELGRVRAKEELRPQPGGKTEEQRKRKLGPERAQVVKEQVQALLEAGFIKDVKYPAWLANVVLVKQQTASGGCALITPT
nr:uncharacterized protein LOC112732538 [Arachis hypogaea]